MVLLLLYMISYMMIACNTISAQQQFGTQEEVQPLLRFQKTPCLGFCPAYNATLYTDGSAAFVPFEKGEAQDTLHLQLTQQEVKQIKQEIKALNYPSLKNEYLSGWSDIPSTYLTFYENGKEVKRVKHQEGGPEQLIQFQAYINALLEQRAEDQSNLLD